MAEGRGAAAPHPRRHAAPIRPRARALCRAGPDHHDRHRASSHASAIELDNPLLLQWHNADAVFNDPVPTHIGLALLTHQLGYFDILPLYVVLMLMAPFFALIDRVAKPLVAADFAWRSTWPFSRSDLRCRPGRSPGRGFSTRSPGNSSSCSALPLPTRKVGPGAFARRHIVALRVVALPIVIAGVLMARFACWPDPTTVPNPKLFFIADKTFNTPMRLVQFLSLVAVFSAAWPYIVAASKRPFGWLIGQIVALFSMLGRNSLYVFCVGSLLSLTAQVVRLYYQGSVGSDTLVVCVGILVMAFTAWLAESRIARQARRASLVAALGLALTASAFAQAAPPPAQRRARAGYADCRNHASQAPARSPTKLRCRTSRPRWRTANPSAFSQSAQRPAGSPRKAAAIPTSSRRCSRARCRAST